jgi:hypothetical protein
MRKMTRLLEEILANGVPDVRARKVWFAIKLVCG